MITMAGCIYTLDWKECEVEKYAKAFYLPMV
jgi:hypothetical protein